MKHVLLSLVLLVILLVLAESGKKKKNKEKEAEVEIIELEEEEEEGKKKKSKGKNKDKDKDKGKDKKKCKGKGKKKVCEEDTEVGSVGLSGKEEKSCKKDEGSLVACIAEGTYILNFEEYSFKEELIEELHKSKEYKNMIEEAVDAMADGIVSDYLASDEFQNHIEGVIEEYNQTAEAQETIKKSVDDVVAEETKKLEAKLDEEVQVIKETEVEALDLLEQFVLKLHDLSIENRGIYQSNIEADFLHMVSAFLPDTTAPVWDNTATEFPWNPDSDWKEWDLPDSYVLQVDHGPSEDDGFINYRGVDNQLRDAEGEVPFDNPNDEYYANWNYGRENPIAQEGTGNDPNNARIQDSPFNGNFNFNYGTDYYVPGPIMPMTYMPIPGPIMPMAYMPIPEMSANPGIQDSPFNSNVNNFNYGSDNYAPGPINPRINDDSTIGFYSYYYEFEPIQKQDAPIYNSPGNNNGYDSGHEHIQKQDAPSYNSPGNNNGYNSGYEPIQKQDAPSYNSPGNNNGYDSGHEHIQKQDAPSYNSPGNNNGYNSGYEPIQKQDAPSYNSPGNNNGYNSGYEPIQKQDAPSYNSPGKINGYDSGHEHIQKQDAPSYNSPGNNNGLDNRYYNNLEDDNDQAQIEKVTDEEQEQDPPLNVKQEDSGGSRKPPNSGKNGLKIFAGASGEKGGLIDEIFKKVDIGPKEKVKENDFAKKANNQQQLLKRAPENPANPKSEDVIDEPEQEKSKSTFFNLIKEKAEEQEATTVWKSTPSTGQPVEKVIPVNLKKKAGNNDAVIFG